LRTSHSDNHTTPPLPAPTCYSDPPHTSPEATRPTGDHPCHPPEAECLHAYPGARGGTASGSQSRQRQHLFVQSRSRAGTAAASWWTLAPPRAIHPTVVTAAKGTASGTGLTGNEKK